MLKAREEKQGEKTVLVIEREKTREELETEKWTDLKARIATLEARIAALEKAITR